MIGPLSPLTSWAIVIGVLFGSWWMVRKIGKGER